MASSKRPIRRLPFAHKVTYSLFAIRYSPTRCPTADRRFPMRLKDKVAIVIGAGQSPGDGMGNGRATVLRFAQEGAKVLAVDNNLASAEETIAMAGRRAASASPMRPTSRGRRRSPRWSRRRASAGAASTFSHYNVGREHRRRRCAARQDHRGGVRPHRDHQPARRDHGLQARRAGDAGAARGRHHHDLVGRGLGAVSERGLQGDQGRA